MSDLRSTQTRSDRTVHSGADLALCRSTLYAALALGFRPPEEETIQRLAHPAAAAALAEAARVLEVACGASGLTTRAMALAQPDATVDRLAADFRRLFGHTVRGDVPAYETEYGNEALFQQPQELSDLAGFVRAFGLTLRPEMHERIDHVSCECELLSFLACKEAYALQAGDDDMHAATVRATELFLRDHLGRFVPAFSRRVVRGDPGGFYGSLARLLLELTALECRRRGLAIGSERLGLRPDPAAVAAPMGCGLEGDEGGCGAVKCST